MADYQLSSVGVVREWDGANIPSDPKNRDWRKYQAWERAGGIPDPMPVVVKPPIGDVVEDGITGNPVMAALIRRTAKHDGITEDALIAEIRAEAKEKPIA